MPVVAGIDFSTSITALVALDTDRGWNSYETIKPKMPKQESKEKRGTKIDTPETASAKMARLVLIRDETMSFLDEFSPEIVCIEGYGFQSQMAHSLGECGGMIKALVWECGIDAYLVPPTVLKKFASGDGTASKGMMIRDVWRRWNFDTKDDNVADAYALARVAELIIGKESAARKYALDRITHIPGKR